MKPMMAQALDFDKITTKANGYVMEPKLDGMRLLLHFPEGKLTEALTRSGRNVLPQVPIDWVEAVSPLFPWFIAETGYEWLDCEFGYLKEGCASIMDFNLTMRVMGSGVEEAQRKAGHIVQMPSAVVFDIPDCGNPLYERRDLLTSAMAELEMEALFVIDQRSRWLNAYYEALVQDGGEGVMLKNPNSDYIHGKRRANTWYKIKKFDSVDCFVVGADPGQGKYEGQIGALIVQTTDGLELRCSGMTDLQRMDMTRHLDEMIVAKDVIEVKYFGLTAGTPRHPQFLRYRPDKRWDQCQWIQV
jgi:ATP-dependent DNA ligase